MFKIKPKIENKSFCPACSNLLIVNDVLWQGIHVCAKSRCENCNTDYIEDLGVGQAMFGVYQIDMNNFKLYGPEISKSWFGKPLLDSLKQPLFDTNIELKIERFKTNKEAIIINCIDFLYGHCLAKLLSADYYLKNYPELGAIVIIPQCLRWMVPDGVAEIWTANIPLNKKALAYYPDFDKKMREQCGRFDDIYVAKSFYFRQMSDISLFTRIPKHNFNKKDYRITFIWREDRPWFRNRILIKIFGKSGLYKILLYFQNWKIKYLFRKIHKILPEAKLTVAGLGKSTFFPRWIDDKRVNKFDEETERRLCKIYSESRLIIGVHGSNMMLPSAHAGMIIDLMPDDRWSNLAQDIIYSNHQTTDYSVISWKYHFLPIDASFRSLAHIVEILMNKTNEFLYKSKLMSKENN